MVSKQFSISPKKPMVDILLSTYNGERYLSQLFDSIIEQTYSNCRILVRDDSSIDSTTSIIQDYKQRYPNRIIIIEFSKKNIGYTRSFSILLEASRAEYIAFCDQDDIWELKKIERQMFEIQSIQKKNGKQQPVLVHSDLKICDHKMTLISDSMWKYQKIVPEKMKDIRCLLIQNFVTGCTILMNRALADMVVPIPKEAITFDWWTALLALEQGRIATVQEPLVMYRQHEKNAIGAQKWGTAYLVSMILKKRRLWKMNLKRTVLQAKVLGEYSNNTDREIIHEYAMLDKKYWIKRKTLYLKIGIKKYGWLRQFFAWLYI